MRLTGEILAQILYDRRMSKAEAARRCGYCTQHIINITNGKYALSDKAAMVICARLNITQEELE